MKKYVSMPIQELVNDVPVDPVHIRELADSIMSKGQLSPVIIREETGEVIDGFHRVAALEQLGFKNVECVVTPCDDDTFWDFRIVSASLHKAVTFARAVEWIDQIFDISSWKDKYSSGYSLFHQVRVGEAPQDATDWVVSKARIWGLAIATIENWLYARRSMDSKLFEEVKSSPPKERISPSHYIEVARALPERRELQRKVIDKAEREDLSPSAAFQVAKAIKQAHDEEEIQDILTQPIPNQTEEPASPHAHIVEKLTTGVRQQISEAISMAPEKAERIADIVDEEMRGLQRRLEIFPEKSQKIQPKFDKFRPLLERGVIPYTVWDFPERDDYGGDKDFHGNCSPQIVEQCIWRLTEEGDLVVDPMAGSGTALDVCRKFNRKCIGYDIKPLPNRTDIIQNDSRNIPLESDSVDMIFIHPPYWNLAYFTKAEERLPDLSRANTPKQFLGMLKDVFQECYRVLRHEKYMCVLLGDLIRDGSFIPLCREATNLAEEIGFIDCGYALKLAHGEVSRKKSGVIVAEPIYTDNLKISHDLVMFLRKAGRK